MKLKQIRGAELYYDEETASDANTLADAVCVSEKGIIRPDKISSYDIDLMIVALQRMKKKGANKVVLSFVPLKPAKDNPNQDKISQMILMTHSQQPDKAVVMAPYVEYIDRELGISIPVDKRKISNVARSLASNGLTETELAIAQCLKKTKKVE